VYCANRNEVIGKATFLQKLVLSSGTIFHANTEVSMKKTCIGTASDSISNRNNTFIGRLGAMKKSKCFLGILCVSLFFLYASPSFAAWPADQTITMVIAYSPGGSTDIMARLVANYLEPVIGQKIIVLNKPGAGAEIGYTTLSEAKPDGYTVGFLNTPSIVALPIRKKTRFTLDSFAPVACLMDDPCTVLVREDSPFQTMEEVIQYAKDNPGKLTYGVSGIGSDDHMAMIFLEKLAGISAKVVPFTGAGPNRTALLGGHIDIALFNVSEAKEYSESGQIRMLAQMAEERDPLFPNVVTLKEMGYDVVMTSSRGVAMPAGVPSEIVEKFAEAMKNVVENPEFRKKCEDAYLPLVFMSPSEYTKHLRDLSDKLTKLWEEDPWIKE